MDSPFKDLRIMVLGEVGVDKYVEGISTRQSPECDVPVVTKLQTTIRRPGMAGNVAENLLALGAKVGLFSVIGSDNAGYWLSELYNGLLQDASRKTCVKKRIVCNGKQLARFDYETTRPLKDSTALRFSNHVTVELENYDAVILQDYGKGLWSSEWLQTMIQNATYYGKKVFVDPWSDRDIKDYAGAYLIKPNELELHSLISAATTYQALERLQENTCIPYVVVTRGPLGMLAVNAVRGFVSQSVKPASVVDVCGAGDTALAVLTLMMLKEDNIKKAMDMANKAASLVIQKKGPATVTWEELCAVPEK